MSPSIPKTEKGTRRLPADGCLQFFCGPLWQALWRMQRWHPISAGSIEVRPVFSRPAPLPPDCAVAFPDRAVGNANRV
ncbi:hypothetical protein D9X30_0465 [Cupriavidus sp. U2]|nr:hypothetical protein D9X30_0465 [Cupriavidus sp. U2]